jgi:hypothetical protein
MNRSNNRGWILLLKGLAAKTYTDNSSLLLKVLLRKSLIEMSGISRTTALDLFAGNGEIASRAYADFSELRLVEKSPAKAARLKEKFAGAACKVRIYRTDNLEFLAAQPGALPDPDAVDFDAYGSPNAALRLFFERKKIAKPTAVFATDGYRQSLVRRNAFSPGLYLAGGEQKNAFCDDRLVFRDFEKIIRGFWEELAQRYGFEIRLFKLIWKKGGMVAYYGTIIQPK